MSPLVLIDRFAGLRVLVIGEAMLDSYVHGSVVRLCREAPVPIVSRDGAVEALGGGANAAAAVRALGARVDFVSVIGRDEAGEAIRDLLARGGIDPGGMILAPDRETMVKQRVTGNGQLLVRLDSGSEADVDAISERRLIEAVSAAWERADAVIVSDYGYGICSPAVAAVIAGLQRRSPRILVGDAKDLSVWREAGLSAAKPNYEEARALADLPRVEGTVPRVEQVIAARAALTAATGAEIVVVTLDTAGAVVFDRSCEPYRTFTRPAPNHNAAGAGDTFTAAFTLALAAGAQASAAGDLASAAATCCVAGGGTSICSAAMLREQIAGERKVASASQVEAQVAAWKGARRRIVFTNGCFDLLHHGHITYLNRAKAMGDVLVIGLNSDASVRRLKGESRPINAEDDRAAVLAALSCVDLVVLFEEPTPIRLIEAIRPDLFVKGGDYTLETLPEAPLVKALGGEVKLLPYLDDRSTTGIIERIRRADAPTLEAVG